MSDSDIVVEKVRNALSSIARAVEILMSTADAVAELQVSDDACDVLKYVSQYLRVYIHSDRTIEIKLNDKTLLTIYPDGEIRHAKKEEVMKALVELLRDAYIHICNAVRALKETYSTLRQQEAQSKQSQS